MKRRNMPVLKEGESVKFLEPMGAGGQCPFSGARKISDTNKQCPKKDPSILRAGFTCMRKTAKRTGKKPGRY